MRRPLPLKLLAVLLLAAATAGLGASSWHGVHLGAVDAPAASLPRIAAPEPGASELCPLCPALRQVRSPLAGAAPVPLPGTHVADRIPGDALAEPPRRPELARTPPRGPPALV